jgi:hypothetical protein
VYYAERRSREEPAFPHSVEVQIVSQLGVVGTALALTFLGAIAIAIARQLRNRSIGAVVAGAVLAGSTYWLAHASADWFWEIPGVTAPLFALLGMTCALGAGPSDRLRFGRPALIGSAAGLAIALVVVLAPWQSDRIVRTAMSEWQADPGLAYARLDRASQFDPLTSTPYSLAAQIAEATGDEQRALREWRLLVEREPDAWFYRLRLGAALSANGRPAEAITEVVRAHELNPLEPVLTDVLRMLRSGRTVAPEDLGVIFAEAGRRSFD